MADKVTILRIEVQGFGETKQDLEFLTTETDKLAQSKRLLKQESTLAAKAINAEAGSIAKLRADTALLRQQANNMRGVTQQEIAARNQLISKINQNTIAIRDYDRAMSGSNTLVGEYSRGIAASAKSVGGAILGIGSAVAIALKLVQGLGSIIKTSVNFEAAMSNVRAVSGATAEEMDKLTQSAISLGGSTKFTASEVAGLQTELAKLGFTTGEILNMTAAILSLAAATGTDLATSANVAGSVLRQFGLASTEMTKVVDVMTLSFSRSALDMTKFETAMASAGPVAASVGETIETTAGKLSVLANRGLDASTSGTSLRNIFLELQKRGLSWDEAMDRIQGSQNKASESLELFGKRGAVAGLILAENREEVAALSKEYESAAGSAKEMADVMIDNVAGSATILKSAWEGLILRTNDSNGALKGFLDMLTNVVITINTKGKPAIDSLFETREIEKFGDKWEFYAAQGLGFFGTLIQASVRSKETTQEWADGLSEAYQKEMDAQNAVLEERSRVEAEKKRLADEELARQQAAVDAAEKAAAAREKIRKKEEADIKKGEEQRAKNLQKYVEDATKDNKKVEAPRLGIQKEEFNQLVTLSEAAIATEQEKQDRITEITADGANKRKLTYEQELQLQMAAIEGVEAAAQGIFNNKRDRLNAEMQAELDNENLTEQQRAEIKKKYAREQQKNDIKQAFINAALGITKTFVEYGFTPAGWVAAAALAVQSAIQIGIIKAQKFASGGRITGGARIKPDSRGDDTLIIAKQGEVILNQRQQLALGSASLKRAGVPGFADGGIVGGITPSAGYGGDMGAFVDRLIAGINDKRVQLVLPELNEAQKRLDIITKSGSL